MIRHCTDADFDRIHAVINDAAQAYRGVIPDDYWKQPYMSAEELKHEIESGVRFWGWEEGGTLLGVMGMQDVADVTLIRHAYVQSTYRNRGIGSALLANLRGLTDRPIMIGTWAAAHWAIQFYKKHGFVLASPDEKNRLLRTYWHIAQRQLETSVVLIESNRHTDRHLDGRRP